MKKSASLLIAIALILAASFNSIAQVKTAIEKANKQGKAVFLVVTDGKEDIEHAKKLATESKKQVAKSEVLTLDKSDKANADLVKEYGIAGATTPLILIVASNGTVCGGMPANTATVESLIDAVPTPSQAKALQAFSEKKAVFIILSKKTMKDKAAAITECKTACTKLSDNAVYLDIDLDDQNEKLFLALIKAKTDATKTNVIVFNSKGQLAGSYEAPVKAADLEAATKKVIKSCCPSGSKSGC